MLFNSYLFLLGFLPICLLGFYTLGHFRPQSQAMAWLVLCSLIFYCWWDPIYLILIVLSIGFNYSLGLRIAEYASGQSSWAKRLCTLGVIANLGLLGYFKYANFFVDNVNAWVGSHLQLAPIVLPLAISFFTFQQISFLVDAYKGIAQEQNFLKYCLFVCFFPQLIAGPIVHHQEMLPQFSQSKIYRFRFKALAVGGSLFTLGLAKKVLIADQLAPFANVVFSSAAQGVALTFFEAWAGALSYTFQLYFDFSGYSDMAIGLGAMFGIRLALNFNSPYKATNIIDFWRRWHMTLSRFLRDYVYIPLGGNRHGHMRRFTYLWITMLLGGLWHGAGWTFVVWGALHGGYLILNHGWRAIRPHGLVALKGYEMVSRIVTLGMVIVAWVFFKSDTFEQALNVLRAMLGSNGLSLPRFLGQLIPELSVGSGIYFDGLFANNLAYWPIGVAWISLAFGLSQWAPNSQQWMAKYTPALCAPVTLPHSFWVWRPTLKWAAVVGTLMVFSLLQFTQISEFLYFQF